MKWFVVALLAITAAVVETALPAGAQRADDPTWVLLGDDDLAALTDGVEPTLNPVSFIGATLDQELLDEALATAPMEGADAFAPVAVRVPSPTGQLRSFEVFEAAVFEPALADKFPDVRAYVGTATDGSGDTIRLESSASGFRAQVASTTGWWYVDPRVHLDTSVYVSYFKHDLPSDFRRTPAVQGPEGRDIGLEVPEVDDFTPPSPQQLANGTQLRTYRLAVSTDSTYSDFHGGTVPAVMAELATVINRLNGIYVPEVAIRFQLVSDNDQLVFLTDSGCPGGTWSTPAAGPSCDPFVESDGTNLDRNQATVDAVIGDANYDIGHVFVGTDCGLASGPAVGVSGVKAEGCSGLSTFVGGSINDPFTVDYVAHEIGHQFGANHTFHSCGGPSFRFSSTAFEPGSGTTILGYAGICGDDDVQIPGTATGATGASDPYFHSASLDEIIAYTTAPGSAGNLGASPSGNTAPVAIAGPDGAIPASTPFRLTGRGTDADSGTMLRHGWEQRDLGTSFPLGNPEISAGPLFRSRPPTTDPSRYLPSLEAIAAGNTNLAGPCAPADRVDADAQQCWSEFVPDVAREMNFRLTVRDGDATAGGVNSDDLVVDVIDTGAPFAVTAPNIAGSFVGGSTQTVTWDVAGTTAAPIGADEVTIRMSIDDGMSYPFVLEASTPNDGSQSVTFPGVASDSPARVMVERAGDECGVFFFDTSDVSFTLTTGGTPSPPPSATACTTPPPPEPPQPPVGSDEAFTSLAPARFVDTRAVGQTIDDLFEQEGKRTAGSQYRVDIAGRGDVPADAKAAIMNVTAIAAEGTGFVTVHPCVSPRPLASSLNYTAGVNLGNEIVAPLNASGEICMFTSSGAHLAVDVTGFVGASSPTTPVTPARYLDTRDNGDTFDSDQVGGGKPRADDTVFVTVAGRGDVPADAAAVIVNVTAIAAEGTGFVTVDPCNPVLPTASSLNFVAGVNRGNELIATLDSVGDICLFTSTAVHLSADVVGYLPAGTDLTPVGPARLLDTRAAGETVDGDAEGEGKRGPGSQYTLQVAGRGGVDAGASTAVVNVTAVAAEGVGFVTVHPCVSPLPTASSLNHVAGVNGGNEIIAQLSTSGTLCIFTSARTHLTVDVVGAVG